MGTDERRPYEATNPEREWSIVLRDGTTALAKGHKIVVENGQLLVVRYPEARTGGGVTTFGSGAGAWATFTEVREPDSAGGKASSISRRSA